MLNVPVIQKQAPIAKSVSPGANTNGNASRLLKIIDVGRATISQRSHIIASGTELFHRNATEKISNGHDQKENALLRPLMHGCSMLSVPETCTLVCQDRENV